MPDLIRAFMIVQRGLPGQARHLAAFQQWRLKAHTTTTIGCDGQAAEVLARRAIAAFDAKWGQFVISHLSLFA